MDSLNIRRVWIEKARCTAHKLCISEAPGLIEYDAKSDVSFINEIVLKRTFAELKLLLEASDVCPMDAFYIETDDGNIFNAYDPLILGLVKEGRYQWA